LNTFLSGARFFGVSDPRDLDDLFDVLRFFGLFDSRNLRDPGDLEDQLRLLRFFGLDDLRDLRFRISRIESGRASPSVNISNTGNNVNLCLGIQQVVNTGNVANQQGVFQYNNEAGDGFLFDRGDRGFLFDRGDRGFLFDRGDRFGFFDGFDNNDIDFEGSSIQINPDQVVECQQTIIQAAASGIPLVQPSSALAAAPASVAAAPVAAVASGAGVAGPSVGLPVARGAGLAQLPRTGGLTLLPLVALGLTALGGGLIFWRLRRR
jgi:LPXTG-motif cell wall-anchored protein